MKAFLVIRDPIYQKPLGVLLAKSDDDAVKFLNAIVIETYKRRVDGKTLSEMYIEASKEVLLQKIGASVLTGRIGYGLGPSLEDKIKVILREVPLLQTPPSL